MGGGPPCFLQGSTCLVVLWYRPPSISLRVRDFHPLWSAFPKQFRLKISGFRRPATPWCSHHGLGSSAFARRYLRNRFFFLFLPLLRCFSSRAYLPYVMDWRMDVRSLSVRVSPFRNPRITDHVHLPAAYRSLSRLSSAQSAKASAPRPSSLDHVSSSLFPFRASIGCLPFSFSVTSI